MIHSTCVCVCVYGAGVSIKHGELTTMTINRIAILASRLFRSFVRSLVSSLVRCLFDDGHSHSSTFFPIRLGVCVYVWVHMNGNIWPFFCCCYFVIIFLVDEGQSKTANTHKQTNNGPCFCLRVLVWFNNKK